MVDTLPVVTDRRTPYGEERMHLELEGGWFNKGGTPLNIFPSHCEPEGRGNLTPSLPSPLEGKGEGGGLLRRSVPRNGELFIAFVLVFLALKDSIVSVSPTGSSG